LIAFTGADSFCQLQALQSTAGRARHSSAHPPPSPLNGNAINSPSPANYAAPSPAAPSPAGTSAPSPAPHTPFNPQTPSTGPVPLTATPQSGPPRPPSQRPPATAIGINGQPATLAPGVAPDQRLTDAQRSTLLASAENIRAANAQAALGRPPAGSPAPSNVRPPRPPGPAQVRSPADPAASRMAFQSTMSGYYKALGVTPPPEVWANGVRDGAVNVGGAWIYLLDLFMLVMKLGGVQQVNYLRADIEN
jgi:hypothetical protein